MNTQQSDIKPCTQKYLMLLTDLVPENYLIRTLGEGMDIEPLLKQYK